MKARRIERENFYFLSIVCFHHMEYGNGNRYYYINDHLFTPQKMIDTSGNTVWQADWDSFGTLTVTINTVENNLRFPGQYYDSETGFYYNFHRYYMPEIGRYLREDEVRDKWDFNLYVYVGDRPVDSIDFTGLEEDNGENNGSSGYEKCVEICRNYYRREVEKCREDLTRCSIWYTGAIIIFSVTSAFATEGGSMLVEGGLAANTLRGMLIRRGGYIIGGFGFWCYYGWWGCNRTAWEHYKKCVCDCKNAFGGK